MTIMPETNLDERYLLLRRLAFGGMGEVWEGTDTVLDRAVAVKILRAELADDDAFRRRFRAEARVAGRVPHPGIASVYDYGETSVDGKGLAYLVMELVPGEALSAVLAREGALGTDRSLDVVAQAARALHAAHERGVIHRDVKPANLMVTPDGRVKVTDFGIARPDDHEPLTATGQVMGTAHYLAPELARGRAATSASDIYALGVVMYECLAGRRPFEGDDQIGVATAHLAEEPPPLPGTIAPEVRALVTAAMEKDPARRIGGADVFAAAAEGLRLRPRGDGDHYGAGGAPTALALGGAGLAGTVPADPATPAGWPVQQYPASQPQPSYQHPSYQQPAYPQEPYPGDSYPGVSPFLTGGATPAPGTAAANGALLSGATPPGGPGLYQRPATAPMTLPGAGGVGRRGRTFSLPLVALVLLVLLVLVGTAIAQLRPQGTGSPDPGTIPTPSPTVSKRSTSPSPSPRTPTAGGVSTGPVRPPVGSPSRSRSVTPSPTRTPTPTATVSPSSPTPSVSTPAASGTTSASPTTTPTPTEPTPTPGSEDGQGAAGARAAGVVGAASATGDTGGSGSTT